MKPSLSFARSSLTLDFLGLVIGRPVRRLPVDELPIDIEAGLEERDGPPGIKITGPPVVRTYGASAEKLTTSDGGRRADRRKCGLDLFDVVDGHGSPQR